MTTTDVYEFEGEEISEFAVQIPSTKLETGKSYPRGTTLNMNVSFRVRSVRIDEDRHGNMIRTHLLAVEDASVKKAVTPAERRAAMEADEAQEAAAQQKVIQEEPGVEDANKPEVETVAPAEVRNEAASEVVDAEVVDEDFSDVDAKDAQAREAQVTSVEQTEAVDADQYADAGF